MGEITTLNKSLLGFGDDTRWAPTRYTVNYKFHIFGGGLEPQVTHLFFHHLSGLKNPIYIIGTGAPPCRPILRWGPHSHPRKLLVTAILAGRYITSTLRILEKDVIFGVKLHTCFGGPEIWVS